MKTSTVRPAATAFCPYCRAENLLRVVWRERPPAMLYPTVLECHACEQAFEIELPSYLAGPIDIDDDTDEDDVAEIET